jgi:hypothetical protein
MQRHTFTLLVNEGQYCTKILRYINQNITEINRLGVVLVIKKISAGSNLKKLQSKGINSLPVLFTRNGDHLKGYKKIMDYFEKHINTAVSMKQYQNPYKEEFGNDLGMAQYWSKLMYDTDEKGRRVPSKDETGDSDDDALSSQHIESMMSKYNKSRPAHHMPSMGNNEFVNNKKQIRKKSKMMNDNIESDDDDDYDLSKKPRPKYKVSKSNDRKGDEMDEKMLNAMMDNMPM